MTTGAPIFLVSACASGEEFVAAFRRYADRNGLFVPIAAPIPAGRRGRFAVTLADGGVMIEGEADIVSSATTPSVLHGRVGMTLRFVEPDIKSKTVLIELEQARLAMKPQPPSVPPRPAQVPAAPRPKVPTIAGRIDVNNALAECVAIGDIDGLEATVPQVPKSSGPRFVVPTIPPVTGRPKSPSTPPLAAKPPTMPPPRTHTPSAPPPLPPRPLGVTSIASAATRSTGTVPPLSKPPTLPPLAKPSGATPPLARPSGEGPALPRTTTLQAPGGAPAAAPHSQSGPTLVAAPIATPSGSMLPLAKPDGPQSGPTLVAAPVTPMSITTVGAAVTDGWDAASSDLVEDTGDDGPDEDRPDDDAARDTIAMPAVDPQEAIAALARSRSPSDELTIVPSTRAAGLFQAAVLPGSDSDTFASVSVKDVREAVPEPVPEDQPSISRPNPVSNSGKVTLPPPRRTSGTTQPPPGELPVVSARPTISGIAPMRAPTQIGLPIVDGKRPGPRSAEIPLPPVVAEARAKPTLEVSDEPTDITGVPIVAGADDSAAVIASAPPVADVPASPSRPNLPGMMRKTVMGIAVVPDGVTVVPASPSGPIEAPNEGPNEGSSEGPSEGPNEAPNERPTVQAIAELPVEQAEVEPFLEAAINSAKQVDLDDAAADEPTGKPITQRPPVIEEPSGDWTMIPGAAGPTIIPRKPEGKAAPTGDWTIARVESAPDGWSEPAKVAPVRPNIRSNTGPPVAAVAGEKPLEVTMTAKAFDIEEETKSAAKVEVDASLEVERPLAGIDVALASTQFATPQPIMTPPPGMLQPPVRPSPVPSMTRLPSASSGSFRELAPRGSAPADLFAKHAHIGDSTSMIDTGRKKRIAIIAASAGLAIVVGVVLLIVFGLGGTPEQSEASRGVAPPITGDAAAEVPVVDAASAEPVADAAPTAIAPSGECFVEVSSTPPGAEVVRDKDVIGTTPAKLALPCGTEAKLVVRKAKFGSSARSVTPTPEGAKLRVALGKTLLSVKVTSSPPGATITIAGKSAGVTPAMIKLPAGETAALTITKQGFTSDTPKITPKQNNQSVHVNLKKKGR